MNSRNATGIKEHNKSFFFFFLISIHLCVIYLWGLHCYQVVIWFCSCMSFDFGFFKIFSCSLVPIWFRLDQYQRRDWCSYRAVRGRVRLVCHRGICGKTHIEEGWKKKKSFNNWAIMFVFVFFSPIFFFLNPGFALIMFNTCYLWYTFKHTSVKTAWLFFHSFWEVASRVSDTFLDGLTL